MYKRDLQKIITLSMVLATVCWGRAEATFNTGTYDMGGTINLTNRYIEATGDVTINATDDTTFNTNNQYIISSYYAPNAIITVNMNNHDLTTQQGKLVYMYAKGTQVNINDVHDLAIYSDGNNNLIHGNQNNGKATIQINHDFILKAGSDKKLYPAVWFGHGTTLDLVAGHDVKMELLNTNILRSVDTSTVHIKAGNDIVFTGGAYPIATAEGATTVFEADHDVNFYGDNNIGVFAIDSGTFNITAGNNILLQDNRISERTNAQVNLTAPTISIFNKGNTITSMSGAKANLNAQGDILLSSSGTSANIATTGDDTIVNVISKTGKIDVLSTGGNSVAVLSDPGSIVNLQSAKDITIGGDAQRGIRAIGGTTNVTSENGKISVTATNTSDGTGLNAGIYARTDTTRGVVNLNSDTDISAVLKGVHANNGTVNFAKNVTITDAQNGIVAESTGEVSVGGNAVITSSDTNVAANNSKVTFAQEASLTGAQKGIVAENAGEVSIAGNAAITSTDTNVAANSSKVSFAKDVSLTGAQKGIVAENASEVSIAGNVAIASTGTNVAANNSKVTFAKDVSLTGAQKGILAENAGTVDVAGNAVITSTDTDVAADNGTVTFAQNLTLSGGTTAIAATNGGVVTDTNSLATKMVTGNITADGTNSLVGLQFLNNASYFTGATTVSNSGTINLEFANGAPWNVTADSSLTNLVNNSTINMRYMGKNTNETITTANLSGNGIYIINTDLQASYDNKTVQTNGDKLIITASSSGSNILDLRDISLDEKLASQGYLLLVEDQSNSSATFTGKDLAHGGIFKYRPVITTLNPTDYTGFNASAKNWYLTGFERTVEVSDNTNVTLGLNETRYGSYFTDNDTLLKRLGELRMMKNQPEQDGFWIKFRHGTMTGKKFDGNFTTVMAGYDKKTSQKRYTGAAFSHTSNDFTLGAGTGGSSMDALTVYNTWLGDKNHYFDIVGKVGRMKGDSSYYDILFPENEEFSNWFYSLSGEYGRKNINNANGWYYEPQAQLTLGRINSSEYTTSLGTKVKMGSINSVLGRAGVTVGREYNRDNPDKHSNVYAKVNILHEFRGDVTTSLLDSYGDSYEPTVGYGGTWLNAGIGATVNFNKNTHIYFDLEKNFHGAVTSKWIGQLGCRWTW